MILMSGMIMLIGRLPAAGERGFQSDYAHILMLTPRIFAASVVAYFAGEFTNSFLLAKLKIRTQGKQLWIRTIGSTLIGQVIDTGIFVVIAFAGLFEPSLLLTIILSNYIFKVGVEVICTPVTYRVVHYLKRHEHSDVYDRDTDFNPFKI